MFPVYRNMGSYHVLLKADAFDMCNKSDTHNIHPLIISWILGQLSVTLYPFEKQAFQGANIFSKFGGNWMRNVQVRERTKLKWPILTNSGAITLECLKRLGWL